MKWANTCCAMLGLLIAGIGVAAGAATTVEVTDKVLVKDTVRLGINLCSDNYWDSAILKTRAEENFEGVRYRMCTWGPAQDEHGVYVWFPPAKDAWAAIKGRVRYTILGGPAKGMTGLVSNIEERVCETDAQKRRLCYIAFDKEVPRSPMVNNTGINGLLLELDHPEQGSIRDTENPAHWNTLGNTAHIGDVPPGSFGCAALWLKGAEAPAHYTYVPMWGSMAEQNGAWRVQLWAKAKSGAPKFEVAMGRQATEVTLGAEWRRHDLTIPVTGVPTNENLSIRLVASGGEVLVDDVVIAKEEPSRNPTPFRDLVVDPLIKLKPGVLRYLQMGGSDLETNLRPALQQMAWTRDFSDLLRGGRNNASRYDFNLHDFYALCEYIGADPWYCLPGTLHPEEINILMEYLAAPADVGYGRRRAELGHPKPWTEVFRNIYVEFGNEAWNPSGYATGSFNGPDHWKDMTAIGKASAHYRTNVLFVAGSQAGSPGVTRHVLSAVPNCDRVAVAPYMIHNLLKADSDPLDTDDKLFRWVFGFAARRITEPAGSMRQHFEAAQAKGVELAIYEHNYHITHPSVKDGGAPIDVRNRIIASLGGGLNLVNDSLHMMRNLGLRSQCLFNLNQRSFREGVKLWGFMPGLSLQAPRYRPSFLATEIANRVVAGDLVETVHAGEQPVFAASGVFEDARGKAQTCEGVPAIWSYAFRDGARRGLVLFNLDTQAAHPVEVRFAGGAKDKRATLWRLAADSIAANNEAENGAPQVAIREEVLSEYSSGRNLNLPAHSMLVLAWEAEP